MIYIDFFDHKKLVEAFRKLYLDDRDELIRLSLEAAKQDNCVLYFVEQTGIQIDTIDVGDVYIHCKHITTAIDNLESIKQSGLITLNRVIDERAPLTRFLEDHKIFFDIPNRVVRYNSKNFNLPYSEDECRECFYETNCQHNTDILSNYTSVTYRDLACTFRRGINNLRSTLYHDLGEIEVFLAGNDKDIHNYSTIKSHPEILYTIERMINKLFEKKVSLCQDWLSHTNGNYYCLDFDVNIKDFEQSTTSSYYHDSVPLLNHCQRNYISLEDANVDFHMNSFILFAGIPLLAFEENTIYGQLLPHIEIPYECITLTEYNITESFGA